MRIPLQEQPLFNCSACGTCCSHIKGFIPEEDKQFVREYAFGKLPVVQLIPVEEMTFPLWDWEAKRFIKWAEEKNIEVVIRPLRAILDSKSKKTIIVTYTIKSAGSACPFLKEKKCAIYDTKRAYVCRSFPFNRGIFLEKGMSLSKEHFGQCGSMEPLLPKIPEDSHQLIPFLKETFPDGEFLDAIQNDLIVEWSNKIIIDLMKEKLIFPLTNRPYDHLMRHYQNMEKVDFTDFLVESGYFSQENMDALVKRFDANSGAREKVAN